MMATQHPTGSAPAPPAWARRPGNLAKAVTAELVERIVRGGYPSERPLPPEPALCAAFSVSRTVIREAVKVLQEKGLVQIRQGSGTMVTSPAVWNMLDESVLAATIAQDESMSIFDDVVATRRVLESDMASVAARLAGKDTLDQLRVVVDRMDALVDDHVAYGEQDWAFHDAIMQASGNRIARAVVRGLESQVVNTARYTGRTERALCVASNRGHRRVYDRIAAHDPEGAAAAMFTHITEAWLVRRGGSGDPERLER
jgi:DNA-binding FadR family transcriptional regulator